MKLSSIVFPGLFALMIFFGCRFSLSPPDSLPRFIPAKKSLHKIGKDQDYQFGYLEVLENRARPGGPTIKLPVYIFKSRSQTPPKDPVIYIVGGPGSSIMSSAPYMNYYQYLDDRDFILFEQRGTQYAQPHLACPEWSEAVYKASWPGLSRESIDSLYREGAIACRERLLSQNIDLNAYNTLASAADVHDLTQSLGIDQYNLLSLSYGTKIAQVLMRDYPEGIRSVVMDSPLPLEVNYDEESVGNLLAAYHLLFQDCALDSACNKRFPDLEKRFFDFLQQANQTPLEVAVSHPETKEVLSFRLMGKDIISLLGVPYTGEIPAVPGNLERILSGEYGLLQNSLASMLQAPGNGNGMGMRLSVWCAEESPFASSEIIRRESEKYPAIKGLSPPVFEPEICGIWGVTPMPETENQPIKSEIPTLLISGGYDNETPPKWAAQMLPNLPNSFHLTFRGWSHGPTTNWGNPCAMTIANMFFNEPGRKPQAACLESIGRPVFETE